MGEEAVGFVGGKAAESGVPFKDVGGDGADFGIGSVRVEEDETADGGFRGHGVAVGEGDPEALRGGEKGEDVLLQAVVGAGGISCRRFNNLECCR